MSNAVNENSSITGQLTGQQCRASFPDMMREATEAPAQPLNKALAKNEPPLCECAQTGKRPLSWAVNVPGLSANKILDRHNLEFAHEHIRFQQSGDNIGFGLHGVYAENTAAHDYTWDATCYDGSVMRQALAEISVPSSYNFFRKNCQDFVQLVREKYLELERIRKYPNAL